MKKVLRGDADTVCWL